MREIKFRAWDSSRNKMFFSNEHKWVEFKINSDGVLIAVNYARGGGEHSLPVMQYTGVNDCNGVEIYEGDLVRITDTEEPRINFVGQVKFGVRGYPAFDLYDSCNTQLMDEYNTLTNDDLTFEVIGNVYENPDLID